MRLQAAVEQVRTCAHAGVAGKAEHFVLRIWTLTQRTPDVVGVGWFVEKGHVVELAYVRGRRVAVSVLEKRTVVVREGQKHIWYGEAEDFLGVRALF